jgi:hypothetical protein
VTHYEYVPAGWWLVFRITTQPTAPVVQFTLTLCDKDITEKSESCHTRSDRASTLHETSRSDSSSTQSSVLLAESISQNTRILQFLINANLSPPLRHCLRKHQHMIFIIPIPTKSDTRLILHVVNLHVLTTAPFMLLLSCQFHCISLELCPDMVYIMFWKNWKTVRFICPRSHAPHVRVVLRLYSLSCLCVTCVTLLS